MGQGQLRSVNIRKVFGASRTTLICEFVKEALVYVGVAKENPMDNLKTE